MSSVFRISCSVLGCFLQTHSFFSPSPLAADLPENGCQRESAVVFVEVAGDEPDLELALSRVGEVEV